MMKEKKDLQLVALLLVLLQASQVQRTVTCDEGEEGSPNEGNTGLICTSPGEPVPEEYIM